MAPALNDWYGPQSITFASVAVNDPLLRPNGKVNTAAGSLALRNCGQQVQVQNGGNPGAPPGKAKTFSLVFAVESMRT